MDNGYSTVRNLLYVVLGFTLLAVLSNFYVGLQLAEHSKALASLQQFLAKQVTGSALTQAQELETRMDALNQTASGVDAKMQQAQAAMDAKLKKAQDDMVARLQLELPKIMDNYVKTRAPLVQKQLEQHGLPH